MVNFIHTKPGKGIEKYGLLRNSFYDMLEFPYINVIGVCIKSQHTKPVFLEDIVDTRLSRFIHMWECLIFRNSTLDSGILTLIFYMKQ